MDNEFVIFEGRYYEAKLIKKIKINNQDFNVVFKEPTFGDGQNLYVVFVLVKVTFFPKTAFEMFGFFDVHKKQTIRTDVIFNIFKKMDMSKEGKKVATTLFNARFANRKVLKIDEWRTFCQSIEALEKPPSIAVAYFREILGKKAYTLGTNFKLKTKINPDTIYLQGLSHVQSTLVSKDYRKIGLAKKMYQLAEKVFGFKIIPASPLSDEGKYLHRSLGNIE
jgi:hypothetical protein